MIEPIISFGLPLLAALVLQLLFCLKGHRKRIKTIPLMLIGAALLIALILFLSAFAKPSGGVAMNIIFAHIIGMVCGMALIGDGIAWMIYILLHRRNRAE